MKKIKGIGGVFFKSKDPKAMKEWYRTNLGLDVGEYGATFEWTDAPAACKNGSTTWNLFSESTKYLEPSNKNFMINYIVEDLEGLFESLKKNGVTICDEIASYDYGKFLHIMDPEGNKIELWEPA